MGKRIRIALLTAAMLLTGVGPGTAGAAGVGLGAAGEGLGDAGQAGPERWLLPQAAYAASAPSSGAISLKVNLVEGADTAEVSLQVDGTVTGTVQSVAAALTYDTHYLTLIDWDAAKTPAVLGETPAAGRTMAPGRVAGKPSLVFQKSVSGSAVTGGATGIETGGAEETGPGGTAGAAEACVYFGAQGQNGVSLETGKELVTLRFSVTGGAADLTGKLRLAEPAEFQDKLTMLAGPATLNVDGTYYRSDWKADGAGMENYAPLTVNTDQIAAPTRGPSLYGGGGGSSGYTLIYNLMGATSGAGITGSALQGQTFDEAGLRQAFSPLTGLKAGDTVTLPAIQLYRSGYVFKGWHPSSDTEGNIYQPKSSFTMPEGNVAFGAVMLKEGGAADPSEFASLSFYDWDETLLGTAVFAKEASPSEVQDVLDTFLKTKYSSYGAIDLDSTADTWVDNEAYPLTYKKGYNFKGWVQVDGGEGTESLADAFTAYETAADFAADRWDYSAAPAEGWGNIVLKAGYVESELLAETGTAAYYTIGNFEGNMYGNSTSNRLGNISITVTAERQNNGIGVKRMRQPTIRGVYRIGDSSVYLQASMPNSDVSNAELVIPKTVDSLEIAVVDLNNTNIVNAGANSSNTVFYNRTALDGGTIENSYIVQGALGSVSKRAAEQNDRMRLRTTSTEWTLGIGAYTIVTELGLTWKTTANTDRYKILLAVYGQGNNATLSLKDLQEVINWEMPNIKLPTVNPGTNANGQAAYDTMQKLYTFLDQAMEAHGGAFSDVNAVKTALDAFRES